MDIIILYKTYIFILTFAELDGDDFELDGIKKLQESIKRGV